MSLFLYIKLENEKIAHRYTKYSSNSIFCMNILERNKCNLKEYADTPVKHITMPIEKVVIINIKYVILNISSTNTHGL